jgi:hypothetical protein
VLLVADAAVTSIAATIEKIAAEQVPAEELAEFEDGTVALYRHGSRIVSPFGLGRESEHDYGRTLLARVIAGEREITLPVAGYRAAAYGVATPEPYLVATGAGDV